MSDVAMLIVVLAGVVTVALNARGMWRTLYGKSVVCNPSSSDPAHTQNLPARRGVGGCDDEDDLTLSIGDDPDDSVLSRPAAGIEPPPDVQALAPPTRFTVYHPQQLSPGEWQTFLAYVHVSDAKFEVEADSKKRLDGKRPIGAREVGSKRPIERNATVRAVPELTGCRFNPPVQQVLWVEDWHALAFRVQASPERPDFVANAAVNGRVAFFVETVLVAEVPIWALISEHGEIAPPSALSPSTADPYDAIFVSYAHDDAMVVETLGRSYKALGMKMLRDVEVLRSGEQWNPRLLDLIEEADIFQLYWSAAAKRSPDVEQEWRFALEHCREHLIRPVYWSLPMPAPPVELSHLHFAKTELGPHFSPGGG